ncbi:class I SAM-dependent methyltransferase [Microbacterium esteraromaticum]|uniref:Class I SAM-dependent methyltransferase n=1 Tax=Microbacterium esteraromaticum TaxID=57043 RepID=A0A7D7WBJ7_9MICO|nr:class I SAM-dependent methyltransferase [Microbacterium esteraromaticum]QMU96497.1 class I SAM-dependent methyltransferase [Microbacterium esteraromaticum]
MTQELYSDARLYDLLFPADDVAVDFYRAEAGSAGERVLELGSGTGHKLIPVAADGHQSVGLDLSPAMLAEARRKADERGVSVEWRHGDMSDFDLDGEFDLIFIAANALLHLHEADDIVQCFRAVRRHLAPGGRFAFDVFNPSVRLLAGADGTRRPRTCFTDPDRGDVRVDVDDAYDAAAQVTRGTWYFSTDSESDFQKVSLAVRSIFPQELPVLLELGGLRLIERFGDWDRALFTADSSIQLCVCESDA